ncbi:unnamed protein product [Hyaloperonospora brassicae]|uniref:DZANK-type domain-containing protein n=1 Tax=Hyaloperonospora brassicae TaxID=162125 RepID=A0AAV0UNB5_HYABA|nr:unnamed protein product [Hyaloperonospora brassicae]
MSHGRARHSPLSPAQVPAPAPPLEPPLQSRDVRLLVPRMVFCGECGSPLAPSDLQAPTCPHCGQARPGVDAALPPADAAQALAEYEAQQRAAVEHANARRQAELEAQRQQHLEVAQAARARREAAEREAQEKLAKAAKLRAAALAAQEELEKQEAKRVAKERQREESRRLREEQQRREAKRRAAQEDARRAFEAKREEEQRWAQAKEDEDRLRREAVRLSTLSESAAALVAATSSAAAAPAAAATTIACVQCNASLKAAQKFCLQCGTKVAAAPVAVTSGSSWSSPAAGNAVGGSGFAAPLQRTQSSLSNSSSSSSFSLPGGDHKCTTCSFTLKAAQKFCPKCGSKVLGAAPAPAAMPSPASSVSSVSSFSALELTPATPSACTGCSKPVKPTQKFCLHCGTKVTAAATPAAVAPSLPSSSYATVPLPAPIPTFGSQSASASQPSTKRCPTCSKECKFGAKFCMGCGFNFAKSDEEEVARNMETARLRRQGVRDQEQQQRQQASLMANQAAQAFQPSW